MKLIVAVVQDKDGARLLDALVERGFRATKLATTGGFLREGNTTVLVGTEDDAVEDVLAVIRAVCRPRQHVVSLPSGTGVDAYTSYPIEVQVGGATVFVLDVVRFERV